tara:strand:- start:22 stop:615 length:594 start_codon:yes stop_codon:yes gene_type:complete
MDIIIELEDALTKDECNIVIESHRDKLHRAEVVKNNKKGNTEVHRARTNSEAFYDKDDKNKELTEVMSKIKDYISAITRLPLENQEDPIILNYQKEQKYDPHYDWFEEEGGYWDGEKNTGGQRLYSVLFYLNDVKEGGETFYPKLDRKIKPKTGKMICHKNTHDGVCLRNSLHGAMPVIAGEKWALVCWIRENKWIA